MEKKRLVRPEDGQGWEPCAKKQRPSKRSCEGCAKGHQSCDKTRPQCGNCQRKRKACAYDDACAPVVALQPRPASDQSELVRQQRELIEQQQALIEHLKQVLTTPSIQPTSRSNSRPSLHQTSTHTTSSPPPPPSAVVLPTNFPCLQLAWDPNEGELHSLHCQSKLIWRHSHDRDEAIERVLQLLKGFVARHPDRLVALIRKDGVVPTTLVASTALFHELIQLSPAAVQEMISKEMSPLSSQSRAQAIRDILHSGMIASRSGHTFLYEKSSEIFLKDRVITASSLISIFFDSSNAMFAGLSLLTPHPSPQPVAKPVVLSTFCSTCSTVANSSSSHLLSSELSSSLHSDAPSDPHPLPPGLSSPLLPPSTPLPFSVLSTPTHSIAPSSLSLDDWVFGGDLFRLLHSESASLT